MSETIATLFASQAEVDEFLAIARKDAVAKTFDTSDGDRIKKLVECMGDTRGMTRLAVAETIGLLGKPATPFLIEGLLNHENVVVRRACAKTITLIGDTAAVKDLVYAHLNDEDTVVKGSTIGALARMGESAVKELLEFIKAPETSESTKGHAAWALAFIGAEAKQYLYNEINSDSESVRSAIVGAIAKIAADKGETEDFDALVNFLDDKSETVRCETAAVLGNLTHKPAIPKLIELLDHPEGITRKAAALALMKIKDTSVIPQLQTALEKEQDDTLQPIYKLAISLLERQLDEDDDEDWD
ncbi:PBS lyase HEAT domain protein repeat-containing protein [[Leptolyngbya] sp. PCC 7376]|uniref:HEAT repeat domain-containing protein n=1 Tax=[Leptolyngbya] sp. PCC 7376 TaxID=111781 RepID=UPI00029F2575|nr:HEAT repeat domain-containing protein [[Leptolyngbya] sp. PCC 7376]AFY40210.1 PBS lyase HEAT domain protein repeat-containing protein [[Leptolyngbya] sp. PCC 7376]